MPTIEIISIDCPRIPDLPRYRTFAYRADMDLVGHRGLFQPEFDALRGVMVHLGNKELEHSRSRWFAGTLVDWPCDDALLFRPEVRDEVADLMQRLVQASPVQQIVFAADYQFGGPRMTCGEVSLGEFLRLHDRHSLRYNTLWRVRRDSERERQAQARQSAGNWHASHA